LSWRSNAVAPINTQTNEDFAVSAQGGFGNAFTALGSAPNVNGVIGVLAMIGAIALTIYSLALYLRSYGRVFTGAPVRGRS
jgi:hypothetical protein